MHYQLSLKSVIAIGNLSWHYPEHAELESKIITGICPLDDVCANKITFAASKHIKNSLTLLEQKQLGALIVPQGALLPTQPTVTPILVSDYPLKSIVQLVPHLHQTAATPSTIHATALISSKAKLGKSVAVGAFCVIEDSVAIGDYSIIFPDVTIESGVSLGSHCIIHSGSVLRTGTTLGDHCIVANSTILGSDLLDKSSPQLEGTFEPTPKIKVLDYVDFGAKTNLSIRSDSAITIGTGTKIDNSVNIISPCSIGSHSVLCGQVNLAGNNQVGNQVVLGGAVNVDKNLQITDGVRVGGSASVSTNLDTRGDYSGNPAIPKRRWVRQLSLLGRLD